MNKFVQVVLQLFSIIWLIEGIHSVETNFHLYTRKNSINFINIPYSQANSSKSLIDTNKLSIFVVHGFDSNPNKTNFLDIKNGLLKTDDFNVFLVDWSAGADHGINYIESVKNVKPTGKIIGKFIITVGIDPAKTHCIGHSLGSHVCGFAGKVNKLKRISALDPAAPLFSTAASTERLDKSDAKFVDATHTSIGLGMHKPVGHKDFFVNGGEGQPGCYDGVDIRCSHLRSIDLYAESITSNCKFTSTPCDSYGNYKEGKCQCDPKFGCSSMGYLADQNDQEGSFYLRTNGQKPFCKN